MPDLAIDIIRATHRILREHKLASRLSHNDYVYFLAACNDNIPSVDIGDNAMKQEVERALKSAQLFNTCKKSLEQVDFRTLLSAIGDITKQVNSMPVTRLHGVGLEYHDAVRKELKRMRWQADEAARTLRENEQEEDGLILEHDEMSQKLSVLREQVGEFTAMHN